MSETAREEYTRYPKTVAIMRELGITVELVAENEFDITGYWELVLDKDGNQVFVLAEGERRRESHGGPSRVAEPSRRTARG